jgi:hypothetical protein
VREYSFFGKNGVSFVLRKVFLVNSKGINNFSQLDIKNFYPPFYFILNKNFCLAFFREAIKNADLRRLEKKFS